MARITPQFRCTSCGRKDHAIKKLNKSACDGAKCLMCDAFFHFHYYKKG